METKRQQKVSKLIQRDLSEIFQKEFRPATPGIMVTVTKVNVTPDLSYARVHLSVFGISDKQALVAEVNGQARAIRGLLGSRVRHQLRVIPELQFFEDDSLDYIENIDKLLND